MLLKEFDIPVVIKDETARTRLKTASNISKLGSKNKKPATKKKKSLSE